MDPSLEYLFTYGTLQHTDIQKRLFGRVLKGKEDRLVGYVMKELPPNEEEVIYSIIHFSGNPLDVVEGLLYEIMPQDLQAADIYEGMLYKRELVRLLSGISAWVYVA